MPKPQGMPSYNGGVREQITRTGEFWKSNNNTTVSEMLQGLKELLSRLLSAERLWAAIFSSDIIRCLTLELQHVRDCRETQAASSFIVRKTSNYY